MFRYRRSFLTIKKAWKGHLKVDIGHLGKLEEALAIVPQGSCVFGCRSVSVPGSSLLTDFKSKKPGRVVLWHIQPKA